MGKSNILVWYRHGCLLNKSLVWCRWTHTHTVTHIQTHRLWSKASYRVLLIFSPRNERPQILLSAHNARHPVSLAARIKDGQTSGSATQQLHIQWTKLTSVGWSWCKLGTFTFITSQQLLHPTQKCLQQLWTAQSWLHVPESETTKLTNSAIHSISHSNKKYSWGDFCCICDLIILYGILHFSWHHYNVEIGTCSNIYTISSPNPI